MYYIEEARFVKSAGSSSSYTLDPQKLQECEGIMDQIYQENPNYWPYGLSPSHMDGGLYMVRQASDNSPVGFVGWQERKRGHEKIGYYSVGILPQHRKMGFAKEAVRRLIAKKASGVDRVVAMILKGNEKSEGLARNLGVAVESVG